MPKWSPRSGSWAPGRFVDPKTIDALEEALDRWLAEASGRMDAVQEVVDRWRDVDMKAFTPAVQMVERHGYRSPEWMALRALVDEQTDATAETTVMTDIEWSAIDTLYQVSNYIEVDRFLSHNSYLVDVLVDAHALIEDYFGLDAVARLEVVEDLEMEDCKELLLTIDCPLSADDARDVLEKFDRQWWNYASQNADGLIVDLNYT